MSQENNRKELSVEIKPEIASGVYSNLAILTHSSSEFILDFARLLPGVPKAQVGSRIIMTPENAKKLYVALRDNLQKFENQHGDIKLDNKNQVVIPLGLGPNSGNA